MAVGLEAIPGNEIMAQPQHQQAIQKVMLRATRMVKHLPIIYLSNENKESTNPIPDRKARSMPSLKVSHPPKATCLTARYQEMPGRNPPAG